MKKRHSVLFGASVVQTAPGMRREALLVLALLVFLAYPLRVQAQFVTDTFTGTSGTALSSHTTDSGATWYGLSSVWGPSCMSLNGSGRVYVSSFTGGHAYANATPAGAEYQVQVTIHAPILYGRAGVIARCSSSAFTCYAAYQSCSGAGGNYIKLVKIVNFTETVLGSYSHTPSSGDVIKLECYNSSKVVYLNGTSILTSSDNTITATGYPGIYLWNDSDDLMPGYDLEVKATFTATNKP